jgi:transcriptional regulator
MNSGNSIMLFRKFKNKTQGDIAKSLKTTQQYISELEKQPHLNDETIDKILNALNCDKDEWEKFKNILPLH